MLSKSRNGIADLAATDRLNDRDNTAGIGYKTAGISYNAAGISNNFAEIDDNSWEIGNNSRGISNIAAKVIQS